VDTCLKVRDIWSQPNSVFEAFRKDTVGKCDACFRAGYCSMSMCEAQKQQELQVITQIVNKAQFSGLIESGPLNDMFKGAKKDVKVNIKKDKNEVTKLIESQKSLKDFNKSMKKISGKLDKISTAKNSKDLKKAIKSVKKELKTNEKTAPAKKVEKAAKKNPKRIEKV